MENEELKREFFFKFTEGRTKVFLLREDFNLPISGNKSQRFDYCKFFKIITELYSTENLSTLHNFIASLTDDMLKKVCQIIFNNNIEIFRLMLITEIYSYKKSELYKKLKEQKMEEELNKLNLDRVEEKIKNDITTFYNKTKQEVAELAEKLNIPSEDISLENLLK